jgi:tRNA(fMet)-specific endonuclease VapC
MDVRYLLDTNTCIYIHRQRPAGVLTRFQRLRAGEAAVSTVTYGELLFGAEKSSGRERALKVIEDFVSVVRVLPVLPETARTYGGIRAFLEAKGQPIGGNDLWIAAHAKTMNLTLVTNNVREFDRVPGLKIQNWIE